MTPALRHKFSDTFRLRETSSSGRRRLAYLLLAVAALLSAWAIFQDADWRTRNRLARTMGLSAVRDGDSRQALNHFRDAVAADPYDWRSRRNLADLQAALPGGKADAYMNYSLALAYAPPFIDMQGAVRQRDILAQIRAGTLEEPADCLEDMFLAAQAGAKNAFRLRLMPNLRRDFALFWEEWIRRGRGSVRMRTITFDGDDFRARAKLDFPGHSSMTADMISHAGEAWRLERLVSETEK